MKAEISFSKEELAAFCQKHGIGRLAIFGSVPRDDFRPDSDVDVLVELEPDPYPDALRACRNGAGIIGSVRGEQWTCALRAI